MADVSVTSLCQISNGAWSSDTKTSYDAMPEPPESSLPDHSTLNRAVGVVAGSGITWLVGGAAAIVLRYGAVSIGEFVSNTTVAWASMRVPVARPALGRIE